jgi:carbamoylphosphate synthase large subunit
MGGSGGIAHNQENLRKLPKAVWMQVQCRKFWLKKSLLGWKEGLGYLQ